MHDLASRSWQRYLYALRLTRPAHPLPDRPEFELDPLYVPWDKVCCWYRDFLFDRQFDFFRCPYNLELERWSAFVDERCIKPVLQSPDQARLILQATGALAEAPLSFGEAIARIDALFSEIIECSDQRRIFHVPSE